MLECRGIIDIRTSTKSGPTPLFCLWLVVDGAFEFSKTNSAGITR